MRCFKFGLMDRLILWCGTISLVLMIDGIVRNKAESVSHTELFAWSLFFATVTVVFIRLHKRLKRNSASRLERSISHS